MSINIVKESEKILEMLRDSKETTAKLELEMKEMKKSIDAKEKEEIAGVRKKYKERLGKATKSLKAKIEIAKKEKLLAENENQKMIGLLVLKDRKNELSEEEREVLDLLLM